MMTQLFLGLAVGWLAVSSATAQINPTSAGHERRPARRALREARQHPATAEEPRLVVKPVHFKWGRGAQLAAKDDRAKYKFDHKGMARVSEPTALSLRLRRKKSSLNQSPPYGPLATPQPIGTTD